MSTPNPHDSALNDAPTNDKENCASLQGELSDEALDAVAGGRIITTVTTRPSGTGGTGGGTGSGSTGSTGTTTNGGLPIDVFVTPAAPSPIPIPYPNLKT